MTSRLSGLGLKRKAGVAVFPALAGQRDWRSCASCLVLGLAVFLVVVYSERVFEWHEKYLAFVITHENIEADAYPFAILLGMLAMAVRYVANRSTKLAMVIKESEIARAAQLDRLTGLHSRSWAEELLASLDPSELRFCALIDARRFSELNTCFGYGMGDKVLIEIAQRLKGAVPSAFVLGRMNSDVFVVTSHVLASKDEGRGILDAVALTLSQPFHSNLDILIDFSIGVTFIHDTKDSDRDIMRRADIALHNCAIRPEGGVVYFDESMLDTIRRRRQVEMNLRRAINLENVIPHLQPIVDGKTKALVGFEVLARWTDAELGVVSPQEFISVAEQSGLVGKLGEQLIRVACRRAALWPGRLTLSVNLAASDMDDPTTALRILAILGSTGFPARQLQIEITETAELQRSATSVNCIATLRAAGIRVVLDDFGTGYCSFERLAGHQFDGLKIDRTFIHGMEQNADMAAIVMTSVQIGKQLGLSVTAEGVETEAQWKVLCKLGCDMVQGYHFGKPMPLNDAHRMVIDMATEPVVPFKQIVPAKIQMAVTH